MRPLFAEQIADKDLLDDALSSFAGNQYRMGELAGAVMLAQIKKLDGLLEACRKHHRRIRESFANNPHFKIRWVDDGDCGVAVFLFFKDGGEAAYFQERLSAEGIPLGPKSACRNLMTQYPICNKKLTNPGLPPFAEGLGKNVDYPGLNKSMKTDGILGRLIAISIGPQYTEADIDDIIRAIRKVSENIYG
jgi:8-amino-3,8-dideoxy-alpha-D-manno-octulosonate transaminase